MVRVFASGPRVQGSVLDRVIPKIKKMVLETSLLNIQHYKIWIKGKMSNPGKGIVPSAAPQCSSYWKESFRVALDYGQPTHAYWCMCDHDILSSEDNAYRLHAHIPSLSLFLFLSSLSLSLSFTLSILGCLSSKYILHPFCPPGWM